MDKVNKISLIQSFALIALVLFSFLIRVIFLRVPESFIFDEVHYFSAVDSILGGNSPQAFHPPLAFLIMALGKLLFKSEFIGIRIFSVVAGVCGIFFTYLLAKRLSGDFLIPFLAGLFLTFDPLWFVFSRIGMLDIFLALFLLAFVYFYISRNFPAAALFLGLALSTKYIAAFFMAGIFLYGIFCALRGQRGMRELVKLILFFVVGPFIVYWLINGFTFHSFSVIFFFDKILKNLDYLSSISSAAAYTSPWWSWFIIPQYLSATVLIQEPQGKFLREIIMLENPNFLWVGALSVIVSFWLGIKEKNKNLLLIVFFFLLLYLPYALFSRATYLYYILPALPLLHICLSVFLVRFFYCGRFKFLLFLAVLQAAFVFFYLYPLLTGRAI